MNNSSKKAAYLGLGVALAMILSYVELLIPPIFTAVPGIKMGLPNIAIIYILYRMGFKSAFLVSVTRVLLVSLLFGNAMIMIYSLAGAILSIIAMAILKKLNLFSCVGISVCGAVLHNLAQIVVAMILLENAIIGYYMVVLAVSGTVSGIFVGLVGSKITKRF